MRNTFIVQLGVSGAEADALGAYAEQHDVNVHLGGKEGAAEVQLDQLLALDRADALNQARDAYRRLRKAAGLPDAEPLYAFVGYEDQDDAPS